VKKLMSKNSAELLGANLDFRKGRKCDRITRAVTLKETLGKVKHDQLTLVSWNINGARAVYKKGFMDWLAQAQPDIVGLQETRAQAQAAQGGIWIGH